MNKAICICGGADRNGAAARLALETARGLQDAGLQTQTLFLHEPGCGPGLDGRWMDDGDIALALMQADVICIGGDCCLGGVDARTAAFLGQAAHMAETPAGGPPVTCEKIGLSIVAGKDTRECALAADIIERWFECLGIRPVGYLPAGGLDAPDAGALEAAYRAGLNLYEFNCAGRVSFSLSVASGRDARAIAEMSIALFLETGTAGNTPLGKLEKRIWKKLAFEYSGIIAWIKGRPVGFFIYRSETGAEGGSGYRLELCYVRPEYRAWGLGYAAVRRIVDICFRGADTVTVDMDIGFISNAFWARSACVPRSVRFAKPTPVFADEDPLKIIGWEQKQEAEQGIASRVRRYIRRNSVSFSRFLE